MIEFTKIKCQSQCHEVYWEDFHLCKWAIKDATFIWLYNLTIIANLLEHIFNPWLQKMCNAKVSSMPLNLYEIGPSQNVINLKIWKAVLYCFVLFGIYCWFVYKTSYMYYSKFYRRDKKFSYLFAFCYILVRVRLKAYFKFIYRVQVIHWQSFMFLAYCDTFYKNIRDFVTGYCRYDIFTNFWNSINTRCVLLK